MMGRSVEKRMLSVIFKCELGFTSNRREARGCWTKFHNKDNQIKNLEWFGHTARIEDMRYTYIILVGQPERKSAL
jgi:hypothetical protein